MRKIITLILFICILSITQSNNVFAGEFYKTFARKIQKEHSESGQNYYYLQDKSDLVYIHVAIKNAGYSADPVGKSGLSKLVASTILTGAGEYKSYNLSNELVKIGAVIQVNSDIDCLNFIGIVSKSDYPRLIELISKLLKSPHFAKKEFEVHKNRGSQLVEQDLANIEKVAETVWMKAVFPEHQYSNSSIGTRDDIAQLTREDLQNFAREKFTKENMVISVIGDLDVSNFGKYIDLQFNQLPQKSSVNFQIKKVIPTQKEQIILVDKVVDNSAIYFGEKGLSVKDPDFIEGKVLFDIFSGKYADAYLQNKLLKKDSYAYKITSALTNRLASSYFSGSILTTSQNAAICYQTLIDLFTQMQANKVSEADVEWEKKYFISNYTRDLDSNINRVKFLTEIQLHDSLTEVANFDKNIRSLSVESLNKVAKRLFNVTNLTSIIVGNTSVIERDFKK